MAKSNSDPADLKSVWETLSIIDVGDHVKEKNGHSYLSWAWAWTALKDNYPYASFVKHFNEHTQLPFFRDDETGTAYVRVTVSAGGVEVTEVFPVLDYANKSLANPSSFHVNVALQRCLAKGISYLGLGAYLYSGEDFPYTPKEAEVEGKVHKGYDMIADAMTAFLPNKEKVDDLNDFWRRNTDALNVLKSGDLAKYEKVLAAFKARKAELEKDETEKETKPKDEDSDKKTE